MRHIDLDMENLKQRRALLSKDERSSDYLEANPKLFSHSLAWGFEVSKGILTHEKEVHVVCTIAIGGLENKERDANVNPW